MERAAMRPAYFRAMRSALLPLGCAIGLTAAPPAAAQLQNWNPEPWVVEYPDGSRGLQFRNDLDFYLNSYGEEEIKYMRKQVNIWRMNWDGMIKATIEDLRAYSEGHNFDGKLHPIALSDARTGLPYDLERDTGRVRVFMFVSLTNPPARLQVPQWDRLAAKYDSSRVHLFTVYGRELHPGDKKHYKLWPAPKSEDEKRAYGKEFAQLCTLPVLVDGLNDAVYDAYGRVPNGAYVIDPDGRVIFRGTWADHRKIEHILDLMLKWEAGGRPRKLPD
jgi:hypothetical protein